MAIGSRQKSLSSWRRLLIAVVMLIVPELLLARVDIDPRPVNLTLTWSGTDLVITQDFCVQSTQGAAPKDTTVIPYQVTVTPAFSLVSGANQIIGTFSWQDLASGGASYALSQGVGTGFVMVGDTAGCPGGNNGRLTAVFTNAAITAVPPAFYTQTFAVQVSNTGGGRKSFTSNVTMDLTLPDSIQVSQLNDILFGNYNGFDLTADEALCVFRASGGNYGITITPTATGGQFFLENGASAIPFSVTWNDGGGAQGVTPGALLSGLGNTFTGSTSCNNGVGNNATLNVSLTAAQVDANATTSGSHTTTLILLVEMQ